MNKTSFSNLFFIIFIIISGFSAYANEEIPSPFHREDQAVLKEWDPRNFTDPNKFDGGSFRFFYHAISLGSNWAPKFLTNPQLLSGNPLISTSLIDNDHRHIFTPNFGFILQVPPENIVNTHASEALTVVTCPVRFSSFNEAFSCLQKLSDGRNPYTKLNDPFQTPEQILTGTPPNAYNEMVITGMIPQLGTKVTVQGLIVTCDRDGSLANLTDGELGDEISRCLGSRGLPVRTEYNPYIIALRKAGIPILELKVDSR